MNGLIGKNVTRSFSKQIHESLSDIKYDLISTDDISIIKDLNFNGLNITNPYKQSVIEFLDFLDEEAKIIGSVNTVIKESNKLTGYNTDYFGFLQQLNKFNIDLENKKVLILGNGATAKMVQFAAKNKNAKQIAFLVREKRNKDEYTIDLISEVSDSEVLINTTPIGNSFNDYIPFDLKLDDFKNLSAVIDLNYNPLKSRILLEAEKLGKQAINGLYMLTSQAIKANQLLTNNHKVLERTNEIYQKINFYYSNIVLIGMPGSGKSTIAKILAKELEKEHLDTDSIFEEKFNISIQDFLIQNPESLFREKERTIVLESSRLNNKVISTGGGVILNEENILNLRQNGIIIFINRSLENLESALIGRPLIQSKKDLENTYNNRIEKYFYSADIVVDNNDTIQKCIEEIKVKLNEVFNY